MKNRLLNLARHKSVLIVLLLLVAGGAFAWSKKGKASEEVRYATARATRGTLVSSVSGSGSVSSERFVELKPGASGKVVSVSVKEGDVVRAGQVIVQLDSSDVYRSVQSARLNLENAKLALEKTVSVDPFNVQDADRAVEKARESLVKARSDLEKSYEDGHNRVADIFLDLPFVMTGLDDILHGGSVNLGQSNLDAYADLAIRFGEPGESFRDDARRKYQDARVKYDSALARYKAASRFSSHEEIEALIDEMYEALRSVSEAVKSAKNLVDLASDALVRREMKVPTAASAHSASLASHTGKTNGFLSSAFSARNALSSAKNAVRDAEWLIKDRERALEAVAAGADPLDIASRRLAVAEREAALQDALGRYADYAMKAPFDGIVAKVAVERGDSVSSGTAAVTLITENKVAEIALNEVDVTRVRIDQRATLAFDALEDFSLTGRVVEIGRTGRQNQGVVTFDLLIAFDADDERVRPGMNVTASIITAVSGEGIIVPNAAVKYENGEAYVEVLKDGGTIERRGVAVGESNDVSAALASGVAEGETVVTGRIMTGSVSAGAPSGNVRFQGGPGFGGGNIGGAGVRLR